jgi:hypothetical protein
VIRIENPDLDGASVLEIDDFTVVAGGTGTLGKTTIGGTFVPNDNALQWVNMRTLSLAADVESMSMYLSNSGGSSQNVELCIWADSAGAPGALLASSGVQSIPTGTAAGWQTFPVSVALTPGDYWLGAAFNGGTTNMINRFYDVLASAMRYRSVAGGPTNPFGSPTVFNNDCSLYATYTY